MACLKRRRKLLIGATITLSQYLILVISMDLKLNIVSLWGFLFSVYIFENNLHGIIEFTPIILSTILAQVLYLRAHLEAIKMFWQSFYVYSLISSLLTLYIIVMKGGFTFYWEPLLGFVGLQVFGFIFCAVLTFLVNTLLNRKHSPFIQ